MVEFELTRQKATLVDFNPRVEMIGNDPVPAADLKIDCGQPMEVLAFFSPELRAHLFELNGPKDLAGGVRVRHPEINYPLSLDSEMSGAEVIIDYGIGLPMRFTDCVLNAFKVTPMDGGTVGLVFRVQCKPTEEQAGHLFMLMKRPIAITVEPIDTALIEAEVAKGAKKVHETQTAKA